MGVTIPIDSPPVGRAISPISNVGVTRMATAEVETESPVESTELTQFDTRAITFEVQLERIEELAKEYMPLAILDVNDKGQVAAVHEARMTCVKLRTGIQKAGKAKRDAANKYSKAVIACEKSLLDPLSEIETHLENEAGKVAREKERVRKEEEAKYQAQLASRLQALADCGYVCVQSAIEFMPDDEYTALLEEQKAAKKSRDEAAAAEEAERQRRAEENRLKSEQLEKDRLEFDRRRREQDEADAAAKAKEDERLAAERAELDRVRQEQAAAQAKIDAENKRIADEEAERVHRAEIAKAQEEAVEADRLRQARLEEERVKAAALRKERDEAEAKAAAEAEAAEAKRVEAAKPDAEKLMRVADAVSSVRVPEVSSNASPAAHKVLDILNQAAVDIRLIADSLTTKKRSKPPANLPAPEAAK